MYCFGDKNFEMETLLDLHVSRSPESENRIFSGWCVFVVIINPKQIGAETPNLVFTLISYAT